VFAQVSGLGPPSWSGGTDPEQWSRGTFVAHRDGSTACSMCSGSIPPEPDGVVVTVTATGGDTW